MDDDKSLNKEFAQWRHLLYVADSVLELPGDSSSYFELSTLLNSLDEYFPATINPVDNFEGYVVRQFCKSLKKLFAQMEDQGRPSFSGDGLNKMRKARWNARGHGRMVRY